MLLHQSVIGVEAKLAMDKFGIKPDVIIGCAGGGSNLGGLISPFMGEKLRGEADYQFIAVEPASCPSLTRGTFGYDFCHWLRCIRWEADLFRRQIMQAVLDTMV